MKIRRFEKFFNEESEKKKDSGFGWGKTLGTTAAIAGTMYGAKKGIFGNTIRRGYNTAYGHLGNALGSKSMVKSAANDWAKGSVKGPGFFGQFSGKKVGQYKKDLVTKRNEFMNNFNKNSSQGTNINNTTTSNTVKKDVNSSNNSTQTNNNQTSVSNNQTPVNSNNSTNQGTNITATNGQRLVSPSVMNYTNGGFNGLGYRRGFDKGLISYAPNAPRTFSLIIESIFYKQKIFT